MRNLKKVIALVAVFAMLVSTVAFAQTYSDVAETDNYAEAIETLSMLGILTGDDADGDGVMDFRPADTITRAEVAAIVCRIQGLNVANQTSTPFVDVPSTHWASGYVAQAAGQGIINGYGDGNFGPDDNVQYEQVIKMLMETLGYNLFAADNGGYPTGYLTAAQRYGVLEGVIGGAPYTEANRGMVAQMVYNAIDTPLMDKYYYGADATYMIYDGINAAYMTLMSRDLKVAKASGIVDENSYSGGINLDDEKTIKLIANGNDVNYYYLGMDEGDSIEFKQGDVDADAFLGYAVNVYAKKNVNGTYTLLAIAKDSARNNEVAFDVDMFQELDGQKITYEKESGFDATVTIAKTPTVLINGAKTNITLAGIFNATGIYKNNELSGKITLVDTADTTGYEVVNVEIAATAVINNVAPNGQISFLNKVNVPEVDKSVLGTGANGENIPYFKVDPEATDVIINLTKNGEAFDYTELTKYDVLSVKTLAGSGLYNIEVLADGNYIDGYVMATRDSAKEVKLNDGNWYDVDANGYMVKDLESGDSGRFYIDGYGKLVALDDDVDVEGVEVIAADNYAYILNAIADEDTWGNPSIIVQVLDKTGAIYEASLATTTTLVNFNGIDSALAKELLALGTTGKEAEFDLDLEDASSAQMTKLAAAIMNNLVSYTASSAGQVKALTFAQGDDEEDMYLAKSGSGKYDPDDLDLDGVEVDEDTIIFYVSDALDGGKMTYGQNTSASGVVDFSRVAGIETLAEETYEYVAFDAADQAAKALVIMNTSGKISPSANVAVIDSIGDTVVGGDKVKIVEYYVGGELKVATTAADLKLDQLKDAQKGDVYQFNVSNGVITNANEIMDYTRKADGSVDNDAAANSAVYFGAINKISAGGSLKLSGGKSISAGDAQTANVYILDPNLKDELQLYVGSASIAYVNEDITEAVAGSKITVDFEDIADPAGALEVGKDSINGLLDHAFAFNYDGDTIDIVIYKAYEFDYKIDVPAGK